MHLVFEDVEAWHKAHECQRRGQGGSQRWNIGEQKMYVQITLTTKDKDTGTVPT